MEPQLEFTTLEQVAENIERLEVLMDTDKLKAYKYYEVFQTLLKDQKTSLFLLRILERKSGQNHWEMYGGSPKPSLIRSLLMTMNAEIFVYGITDEQEKILSFKSHLTGMALVWFQKFTKRFRLGLTYKILVNGFKRKFLPPNYVRDAKLNLTRLKQHKSVDLYQDQFSELAFFVPGLMEDGETLVRLFKAGLDPRIQAHNSVITATEIFEVVMRVHEVEDSLLRQRTEGHNRYGRRFRKNKMSTGMGFA